MHVVQESAQLIRHQLFAPLIGVNQTVELVDLAGFQLDQGPGFPLPSRLQGGEMKAADSALNTAQPALATFVEMLAQLLLFPFVNKADIVDIRRRHGPVAGGVQLPGIGQLHIEWSPKEYNFHGANQELADTMGKAAGNTFPARLLEVPFELPLCAPDEMG